MTEEKSLQERIDDILFKYRFSTYQDLSRRVKEVLPTKDPNTNRVKLVKMLQKSGFKADTDSFSDNSACWIDVMIREKPMSDLKLVFSFDGDGETLEEINVWLTKYERIERNQDKILSIEGEIDGKEESNDDKD